MPAVTTASAPGRATSIYAELLSNIRQVSVGASLSSPSDSTTKAEVLDNGLEIRISHNGHTEALRLPSRVSQSTTLPINQTNSPDLTWRLPVSPSDVVQSQFSPENQAVPWTAADLKTGSPICCRKCKSCIISDGRIETWKDLPSENWAEMMEFWHCHKPHDHDQKDDETLTTRGYGANNAITAQNAVGFVDLVSFMFSEPDCSGLLFSPTTSDTRSENSAAAMVEGFSGKFLRVSCRSCDEEIGNFNALALSVNLSKWQVTCETTIPAPAPTGPECLAATLIAGISRSGFAKSAITPLFPVDKDKEENAGLQSLYLWVLNPNVIYTSSSSQGRRTAMKVLYQDTSMEQAHKLVESVTSDVQDLSLPEAAMEAAREALKSSSSLLPTRDRVFKDWGVGLLERWTGNI